MFMRRDIFNEMKTETGRTVIPQVIAAGKLKGDI